MVFAVAVEGPVGTIIWTTNKSIENGEEEHDGADQRANETISFGLLGFAIPSSFGEATDQTEE